MTTRYEIELDMLERNSALGARQAIELLRSEFQLALNASHFVALSAEDVTFQIVSRSAPQEGVGRYELALDIVERDAGLCDDTAIELLQREFRRALNASHFWRVCVEDFRVTVLSRTAAATYALRGA